MRDEKRKSREENNEFKIYDDFAAISLIKKNLTLTLTKIY